MGSVSAISVTSMGSVSAISRVVWVANISIAIVGVVISTSQDWVSIVSIAIAKMSGSSFSLSTRLWTTLLVLSHGGDNDGGNDSEEELHSCGLFDVGPVVKIT